MSIAPRLNVVVLCGGSSGERGISLNSARSLVDHLQLPGIELHAIYFDRQLQPHRLDLSNLYSNTPGDFDFKIAQLGQPIEPSRLGAELRKHDIAFPAMHGLFGESGGLQAQLESAGLPFVGSGSESCGRVFGKHQSAQALERHGLFSLPSLLSAVDPGPDRAAFTAFWRAHVDGAAVVKPNNSGSSLGVSVVRTVDAALAAAHEILENRLDHEVLLEPFCRGREFTVLVLEASGRRPVALLPSEIELCTGAGTIFDYRRKYLPTNEVRYFTPPRFGMDTIEAIRTTAEQIFGLFDMRDFARFDGWLLDDGAIWFSDINPVSGMEQNSFLFQQAARVGLSHSDVLCTILRNACDRSGLPAHFGPRQTDADRERIHVVFGGSTSERQVSLMSGTNVWLKLRASDRYQPSPFLLDPDGGVWRLPYGLALLHTVEEIAQECGRACDGGDAHIDPLRARIRAALGLDVQQTDEFAGLPRRMSLDAFVRSGATVFNCLHGGIGEDGTLQAMLEAAGISFTGCGSSASRLCMDKHETASAVRELRLPGVLAPEQIRLTHGELLERSGDPDLWTELTDRLATGAVVIKPIGDGCSAGVAKLTAAAALQTFSRFVREQRSSIPANTLSVDHGIIQLPQGPVAAWLFEGFVETDRVDPERNDLNWERRSGWIEVTVGVVGAAGAMRAMNPSLTVAKGGWLTIEEKFQGGTGVNITPPPAPYVKPEAVAACLEHVEALANGLGLRGYSRIDLFMHVDSGCVRLIEVNTLPGLTPSTVIFHQALAEDPPMRPLQFVERILDLAVESVALR